MSILGPLFLWSWMPIVMFIFAARPVRDALVFSFVFGWLFLPNIGFDIPGFPNYTKMTATTTGVVLSLLIFDLGRIANFRPKWYDSWAFLLVGCRLVSSFNNGYGAWDGCSAMLQQMFFWGFPYFIGRIYLSDLDGAKKLCTGMVMGALAYVPFCLIEIRMSPQFDAWVYNLHRWEGVRMGGYRPRVFMATGLELGMWMSVTTFLAWVLTLSGSIKRLWGYSFRMLTIGLSLVNLLCKSTGALTLLLIGLTLAWLVQKTKKTWPAWLLILLPPGYALTRSTGLWSGNQAVEIAKVMAGEERAQSLEFRFQCEDVLFTYTSQRPIFGYSRNGGFNVSPVTGRQDVIIDGYWIIVFGESGWLGLGTFMAIMIFPMVMTIRRFPVRTWNDPDVAPMVGLAWVLLLYMLDCVSNAMLNPVYAVASGALMGISSTGRVGMERMAEVSLAKARELLNTGHFDEAEHEYQSLVKLNSSLDDGPESQTMRARALDGLNRVYRATDRMEDAETVMRESLEDRLLLADELPDSERLQNLAIAHENLARTLSEHGRSAEAIEERKKALELWATLAIENRDDPEIRERRVASLNDLAWQLVAETDPNLRDPYEAADLALDALRESPESVAPWNTLGVARYRMSDWSGAVEALEHSVAIGLQGGTAFDYFFLAMSYHRLEQAELAEDCFTRAVAWADQNRPGHLDLASFRREAHSLLHGGGTPRFELEKF